MPLSTELPTLDTVNQLEMLEADDPMAVRYAQLMELEEAINEAMRNMESHQLQVKIIFDKKSTPKVFKEGDLVLKWDELKRRLGKHTKFDSMWSKPFIIIECKQHNAFYLSKLDGEMLPILVNGIHLKIYFEV